MWPPSYISLRLRGGWCAENREFHNFGTDVVACFLLGAIPACNVLQHGTMKTLETKAAPRVISVQGGCEMSVTWRLA